MAKEETVLEQLAIIAAAQQAAVKAGLEAAFDAGAAQGGGFSQAQLDEAVLAVQGPLLDKIAGLEAKVAELELKANDYAAKEAAEAEKLSQIQAELEALKA